MKKRIGSVLLALALCLSLLPATALAVDSAWDGSIATAFAGGSGTENDPYQIDDGAQLAYLASEVNKGQTYENSYFVLTADIDLANNDWTPIGNSFADVLFDGPDYRLFAGNLDGKGHTISNISIGTESTPLESDVFGLFGATGGKLSNVNLDGVTIYGTAKNDNVSGYVIGLAGALAGSASGPIENCHVTNLNMTMKIPDANRRVYWIGGLVGALDGRYIDECSVSGSITEKAGKGSIGGLIGELGKAAKITYSRSDVTVNVKADSRGGANVGGFIGKGNGKTDAETIIRNCYATGNVTGGAYTGGFAGGLWGLNIKNCYASGNVSQAAAAMASFVGTDASDPNYYGSITNCFATGSVTGSSPFRYAFAMQDATKRSEITNCYFAEENSSIKNQNESATEKPQDEMKNEAFAAALNGSDDSNGWSFVNGQVLCGAEPADYSAVDAALDKIPADLTAYTDESIKTLSAAAEAVIRGKVIAKQTEVDAMAKAIEDAIAALVKKPSPSSSSSSSSSRPSYSITTPDKTENGSVNISSTSAKRGSIVTITVTPDAGYVLDELTVTDKDGKDVALTKKSDTEYTFVMPAGKVEITPSFVKQAEEPSRVFVDVKTGDYFYDAVLWAVGKGITNGTSAETFSPEDPCTRAQIVTFLWRAAGSPVVNYAMDLSDVAGDAYYAEAVRWALSEGITTGTSADQFSPDATCTREQAVTFLYRAAGSPTVSGESAFEDVGADAYYARAVAWAAQNGVTNGISQALFGTGSDCTRAQIVTFLYRAQQGK